MKKMYKKLLNLFENSRGKWFFPLVGFLALVWFLLRVVPKPSRAAYPCQRAAFPLASSFVIWLVGLFGSVLVAHNIRERLRNSRVVSAAALSVALVGLFVSGFLFQPQNFLQAALQKERTFIPTDAPNSPMGEARGIFPGRVVWSHNPDATSWNGSTGYWWDDSNTDIAVVSQMLSESLQILSGETTDAQAWDGIFSYFNQRHGKDQTTYQPGEKIAIKLNMNNCTTHGTYEDNDSYPSPHVVLALVRQLVNQAGVPDSCITIYDASREIASNIYLSCKIEFNNLRFVDSRPDQNGRFQARVDSSCQVFWSDTLTIEEGGGNETFLPFTVSQADYLINLGNLKGHSLAGVTLCAKNHFGTFMAHSDEFPDFSAPKAAGVHPYVTVHDFHLGGHWNFDERPMETYNSLVDLMGHDHLGEKTLLFMVDGLYAAPAQGGEIQRWQLEPFNNDWTSSLLLSLDGVAIESVGLDFLRSESSQNNVYGNVDNYLHEAAQANNPPSEVFYDPNGNDQGLPSLGVHEHWNNAQDKQYSRNLNTGQGIELVKTNLVTGCPPEIAFSENDFLLYPNPVAEKLNVQCQNLKAQSATLRVYDATGKQLFQLALKNTNGHLQRTVPVRFLPQGSYFAEIQSNDFKAVKRFLIAR